MKFVIDQIAIVPKDPEVAMKLLVDMGATEWATDIVTATGRVFNKESQTNEAQLAFNYQLATGVKEFEILHYTEGANWVDGSSQIYYTSTSNRRNTVSHLGMHCTAEELEHWRVFFAERNIAIAQEVFTSQHTNPMIAGKRWYHYVIFDTKRILGTDIKFIVRLEAPGGEENRP